MRRFRRAPLVLLLAGQMSACRHFSPRESEPPAAGRDQLARHRSAPVAAGTPSAENFAEDDAPTATPTPALGLPSGAKMRPGRARSGRSAPIGRLLAVEASRRTAQQQSAVPPQGERKVHYDGYLRLQVTQPESILDAATKIGMIAGGYVEQRRANRLVLRVPAAAFEQTLDELGELGALLSRRINARDITDAYAATALRLRVLTASRDRLIALLSRATTENDKLSILAEIKRLTENIDLLQTRLKRLDQLAAYSRITLELSPRPQRLAGLAQHDPRVFHWIGQLSPFSQAVAAGADRLELSVPRGMVATDPDDSDGVWIVRSAEGAALWTSERENDPRGDTAFWTAALQHRLQGRFAEIKAATIGAFSVLQLDADQPKTDNRDRYRYMIAIRAVGDKLQLVEAYFPSTKHHRRHQDAVKRVLVNAKEGG